MREEEERKHREAEERKHREAEERKHREAEERKHREAEERKHREAEAETDKTTLEDLKRSSAVLSGGQAGRKKRSKEEFTGSVLTTHSEAAEEEILEDSM